jgi:broad specificity phosphatase PhoE
MFWFRRACARATLSSPYIRIQICVNRQMSEVSFGTFGQKTFAEPDRTDHRGLGWWLRSWDNGLHSDLQSCVLLECFGAKIKC